MENKNIKWVALLLLLGGGYYLWYNKNKKAVTPSPTPNPTPNPNPNNGGITTEPTPPPIHIPTYEGYVETVTPDTIYGWAAIDKDPCSVDVFIDGNKFGTVKPTEARPDVATYLGSDKLNFSFVMAIPEKKGSKDVGKHTVKVVFSGTDIQLYNSPMYYTIQEQPVNIPTTVGGGVRVDPPNTPTPTPYYPPAPPIIEPPIDNGHNQSGIEDFFGTTPPPRTPRGNSNVLIVDNG